jgi:hypothetical protein
MDFSTIGPIIGALGIGSLIIQYLLAGRSRREVRGAVLKGAGVPHPRLHRLDVSALGPQH